MIEIKSRWNNIADREAWVARGASFVTKLKATKAVWFPPEPAEVGTKAATTAKKATTATTKKTAGAATKATRGAQEAAKPAGPEGT